MARVIVGDQQLPAKVVYVGSAMDVWIVDDIYRLFVGDRKPEIRAYVEQLFWQSHHFVAQGIGCGDHFVKVQSLTFTQLERLLMYRKMKRTLANKEEEVEEG